MRSSKGLDGRDFCREEAVYANEEELSWKSELVFPNGPGFGWSPRPLYLRFHLWLK